MAAMSFSLLLNYFTLWGYIINRLRVESVNTLSNSINRSSQPLELVLYTQNGPLISTFAPSNIPSIAPTISKKPITKTPTNSPTFKSSTKIPSATSFTNVIPSSQNPSSKPSSVRILLQPVQLVLYNHSDPLISTFAPTMLPSKLPSKTPSTIPTKSPTFQPSTKSPSKSPTKKPSYLPSKLPSNKPSFSPFKI